jgi:hypothetical protein
MLTCPDCRATAAPDATYCAACGGRMHLPALRLSALIGQLIGGLLSFELPILRTLRDLFRGPGRVAQAWIAGRRRSYINPINLLVIVGVLIAISYEPLMRWRFESAAPGDAVYEAGLARNINQYFALFCIALLVPIAVVSAGLARLLRVRSAWLEWYVLSLYCYGLGSFIQLLLSVVQMAIPHALTRNVIAGVSGLIPVVLLIWGGIDFVEKPLRGALVAFFGQTIGLAVLVLIVWLIQQSIA